jgi:hypothetical protein
MSHNKIKSSEPFISGDLFISYSLLNLTSQMDIALLSTTSKIIFVKTELLEYYMSFLHLLTIPFVLITSCNDDYCVPYYHFPCQDETIKQRHDQLLESPFLLRWFTKNAAIIHPKIASLPLGPKWQYHSTEFFGEDKAPILDCLYRHCLNPSEEFFSSNKKELLYLNFAHSTTDNPFFHEHKNLRRIIANFYQGMFPSSKGGDFETYLTELKKHKFCLSPPGRGIDTHRTWESLMVGTIPILLSSPMDSLFNDLPVIIVDDLLKITPAFLEKEYEILRSKIDNYDFSKLYSQYWKDQIHACFLK